MPGLKCAAPAPALVFAPLLTQVHYSRAALRLISRIAAVLPGVLLGTIAPAIDQRRAITGVRHRFIVGPLRRNRP